VTVVDVSADAAEAARSRAVDGAAGYAARGLLAADAADRVSAGVRAAGSIADGVEGAALVIEAVTEDPGVKDDVLRAVEAAAPASAVIASNTSAIPIALLARSLADPSRFMGMHWFNPPQWVPCVEIIPCPATAPERVADVEAMLRRLGKVPAVVGDGAGFVGNRIQFAMFREAAAIVAEGLASAETVDTVVRSSFGFRLPFFGPFEIADMAGLDVYAGAYEALVAQFGERFSCPEAVTERVERGELGAKTGKGFLELSPDDAARMAAWRDGAYAALEELRGRLGTWGEVPGQSASA
jgi:3-hydroxybutyryl-CoA dehydrogenase